MPANRYKACAPLGMREIEPTFRFDNPILDADQVNPLFIDRQTPLPLVPAKIYSPSERDSKHPIIVSTNPLLFQVVPLSVDLNTPLVVPANIFVPPMSGQTVKDRTLT